MQRQYSCNKCGFEFHAFNNLLHTSGLSRIAISVCLITAERTCPREHNVKFFNYVGLSSHKVQPTFWAILYLTAGGVQSAVFLKVLSLARKGLRFSLFYNQHCSFSNSYLSKNLSIEDNRKQNACCSLQRNNERIDLLRENGFR